MAANVTHERTTSSGVNNPIYIMVGLAAAALLAAGLEVWRMVQSQPVQAGVPGYLVFLWLISGLFLTLGTHELGHLLGGWLSGARFVAFVIGPLKIIRAGGALRVGLNTNLPAYGGVSASLPVGEGRAQARLAAAALGGPVASLLVCALALALAHVSDGVAGAVWLMVAALSFAICLGSSLPLNLAGAITDGGQVWALLRGGVAGEQRALLMLLQASTLSGIRPRDLDQEMLERAIVIHSGTSMDLSARLLGYYSLLDAGEFTLAGRYIAGMLSRIDSYPRAMRPVVYLEAAFFEAFYRRNPRTARAHYDQGRSGPAAMRLRAEAAVLLSEGHADQARQAADACQRRLDRAFDAGLAEAEREWVKMVGE